METVATAYFIIRHKTEMIKIRVVLHELVNIFKIFSDWWTEQINRNLWNGNDRLLSELFCNLKWFLLSWIIWFHILRNFRKDCHNYSIARYRNQVTTFATARTPNLRRMIRYSWMMSRYMWGGDVLLFRNSHGGTEENNKYSVTVSPANNSGMYGCLTNCRVETTVSVTQSQW
jgi:hypothetical protein